MAGKKLPLMRRGEKEGKKRKKKEDERDGLTHISYLDTADTDFL